MLRRVAICLIIASALLCGCVEERLEVVLNADGSGRVSGEVILSDRLMTAYHEVLRTGAPVIGSIMGTRVSSAVLIGYVQSYDEKNLDDALNLHDYRRATLANGAQRTRFAGTFESPTFLDTPFAREVLGLQWAPRSNGSNALYLDLAPRSRDRWAMNLGNPSFPAPTLRMLYGIAQGYRRKVKIQFPFPVEESPSADQLDAYTLQWDLDLGNHASLEKSEMVEALTDEGRASVIFSTDVLPVAYRAAREEAMALAHVENPGMQPTGGMSATLRRVQVTRDQFVNEEAPAAPTQVMFELGLSLPDDAQFMQHQEPRMVRVENADHESLLSCFGSGGRSGIWNEAGGYSVRFYATRPENLPGTLLKLEGVLPVIVATATREVRFGPDTFLTLLRPMHPPRDTSPEITLSQIDTNTAILCSGEVPDPEGVCQVLTVNLLLRDGTYESSWGGQPQGNERQVGFRTPIAEAEQIVVTVVDAYERYDVPFAADEIQLP